MRSLRTFLLSLLVNIFQYLIRKLRNVFSKLKKYQICWIISVIPIVIAVGSMIVNHSSVQENPVVITKVGVIRGLKATDGDYAMFMGIPFARVNESNPFGHAIPYPPFEKVFDAHDDTAICPQLVEHNNTIAGTLDCLHVNIHVPNTASASNRLPILVFLHGGRYEVGFSGRFTYGPKFLVKQNIIVVTLNYRLGPYGFQCLDTPEVPGNQGLKDQVIALKWIKDNIEAFGGDSDQITIAGSSSGGQNVDFHVMYSQGGVFNKAIIGAGAALDQVTMASSDISVPLKLANDLGLQTNDVNEALDFLSKQDPISVINSSSRLNITYKPCVEQQFDGVESFITEFPKNELTNIKNIPVMIGQSTLELLHVFANANLDTLQYKHIFEQQLVKYFDFDKDKLENMVDYVRQFYIGDEKVSEQVKPQIIDFCSDLFQNYPIKKKIEHYLSNGAKEIYYSMFAYSGRRNFLKVFYNVDLDVAGAAHADVIGYLFDISYIQEPTTVNDQLIVDRMTALWANFVKYGNPTPDTTDLLPIKWEPLTNESFPYLNIDLELSMMNAPFRERMMFWDSFFEVNGTRTNDVTKS